MNKTNTENTSKKEMIFCGPKKSTPGSSTGAKRKRQERLKDGTEIVRASNWDILQAYNYNLDVPRGFKSQILTIRKCLACRRQFESFSERMCPCSYKRRKNMASIGGVEIFNESI